MVDSVEIKQHSFEPGAMSIIQMGEELIGHPSTAINELVKNGYDADALNCKVYFYAPKNSSQSFAFIFDNGSGMNKETLFGDWLKPSVSSKRKTKTSAIYKRHLLGSKGIGRLAAMALGESVTVITKKTAASLYNWITIRRELFKEEKLLSKIKFPGDTIKDYSILFKDRAFIKGREGIENDHLLLLLNQGDLNSFSHGTLIIIESLDKSVIKILREDFKQKELFDDQSLKSVSFYKSLATLITPLSLNSDIQKELLQKAIVQKENSIASSTSKFSVEFGTDLIPNQKNNEIDWQLIKPIPVQSVFDYRAYGRVTKAGDIHGFLSYKRLPGNFFEEEIKISHRTVINESLTGKENSLELFDDEEMQKNETGEYYFDLRIYDIGEKENLEKLANEAGFESGAKFRNAFKNFQGLRISKNGFGVKPYGEEVEDWIGLSKERVQDPGRNVNTNQILGYVFFYSPENDSLEEKTNREGFLENKAFIQVKNAISVLFKNIGRKRYNYRLLHGIGRVPSSKHSRPNLAEFLTQINNNNNIDQIRSYSEKFMKEVSTSLDNLEESLSFSERLASLGSSVELIYHEMAQPLSALRTTKSSLDFKKKKITDDALESFISDITTLNSSTDAFAELRESLQPVIGRTRKKLFKPAQTFLKVSNLYKSDLEENEIAIVMDECLLNYEINELEYAFWVTFLNIINNAVYWIKKSEKEGEIRFHMEDECIVISNSGPFINPDIIEHIFAYGITTRQEKNATGLGLAFTQSILSRNNWQITAENRENGPAFIIKEAKNE